LYIVHREQILKSESGRSDGGNPRRAPRYGDELLAWLKPHLENRLAGNDFGRAAGSAFSPAAIANIFSFSAGGLVRCVGTS
jgi:hypothetical protein